jgi:integrase
MRVSKYRDRRTGVFYLNWGSRGERHRIPAAPPGRHEGTRDSSLAEELRKRKERELALSEVQAHLDSSIQYNVERAVQVALGSVRSSAPIGERPQETISVNKAIEKYLVVQSGNRGNSKAHVRNVELQLLKFVEHSKTTNINDISRGHVEDFLASLTGLTPKTRKDKLGIIAGWLRWAKGRDYLSRNPAEGVEAPRVSPGEIIFHTAGEVRALLKAADSLEAEALFKVALFTGIRKSEIFRLQGEWIHLEEREIVLPAQSTKMKKRRRIIPVFDQVLQTFLQLPRRGPLFPLSARSGSSDRVFDELSVKAGIKVGFQSLRRTFVTHALLNGVEPFVAARWAGHDAVVQQERYAGLPGEPMPMTYYGLHLVRHGLPEVRAKRAMKS